VQVFNKWNKVMAWRNILISEGNRCFCVWKCECSCTTIEYQSFVSKCKTMPKEHYNNAGFRGVLPPNLNHNEKFNKIYLTSRFIFIWYWLIALIIGKLYLVL